MSLVFLASVQLGLLQQYCDFTVYVLWGPFWSSLGYYRLAVQGWEHLSLKNRRLAPVIIGNHTAIWEVLILFMMSGGLAFVSV